MRVLFVPRDDAGTIFGGDVVQMQATAEQLRQLGAEVEIGPASRALEQRYDVVHLWTSLHFPRAISAQLDVVEPVRGNTLIAHSTIWAPHHLVRWMDAARRWLFTVHPDGSRISLQTARKELAQIANRELDFTLHDQQLTAFAPHPFTYDCRAALRRIDLILPNSWMELQAIFTYLGDFAEHAIVPNAVDTTLFENADPSQIPDEIKGAPFALMSARFDTRKQQDFAMLAIKELDIPIAFVGERTDLEIFQRTMALAKTHRAPVYYFPFMPHERLRHLYAAARVHLLPSIFESPGLSSLEAAVADCNVVVGNLAFESEYFQDGAYYCDPCDAFSIERAVRKAWSNYDSDAGMRKTLRDRIKSEYTWKRAAEATLNAYGRYAMSATPASAKPTPNF